MANLPLPRDLEGRIVPPGRITKRISADFMFDSALPSWLVVTSGTLTNVLGLDASGGRALVTTGTTTGDTATLSTTVGVDISRMESVRWDLEGFVTNNVGTTLDLNVGLRDTGNTAGVYFTQAGGSTNGVRCRYAGDTTTGQASNANVINLGEGNRNKNISFLLLPKLKHAYYLEDDQVGADWDLSANLPLGVITPSVTITTKDAAAKNFRIHRVALTVTVN